MHLVWPVWFWYSPALHCKQLDMPPVSAYVPGTHATQAEALVLLVMGLAVPAEQFKQASRLRLPVYSLYVPTSHFLKTPLEALPGSGQ